MTRTQRIRRISYATRRPAARRRLLVERTPRAGAPAPYPAPGLRRLAPLVRQAPERQPTRVPRRRKGRLRLVAVNARPRRSRAAVEPPQLRLVRGRAPLLVARPLRRARPAAPPRARESRAGQLIFVLAMAGIGLAALATSVGQILARGM